MKGYYRLATAQLESKDHAAAEATIKQGLSLDANNAQLARLHRAIKQSRRAAAAAATATATAATTAGNGGGRPAAPSSHPHLDSAAAREFRDLQVQHGTTAREYSVVQADLQRAQREDRMYNLTLSELESHPSSADDGYYRSVGKIFMQASRPEVMDHLAGHVASERTKQKECEGRLEHLEKRLRSQQLNMKELTATAASASAR